MEPTGTPAYQLGFAPVDRTVPGDQLQRLADEQSALRRVATLVARGVPPATVFEAVTEELGRLLEVGSSGLVRFEDEHTATLLANWGLFDDVLAPGTQLPIEGTNVVSQVRRTGRPARIDDVGRTGSGPIAEHARRLGTGASIGVPIIVAGRLWGAIVVAARADEVLADDAQARLEQFVELVGTAIANAQAGEELARLADEQAALRRVATLVAEDVDMGHLIEQVGLEMAGMLGATTTSAVTRFEGDGTATIMAASTPPVPDGIEAGQRLPLTGTSISSHVYRERRPVRVDEFAPQATGEIAERALRHGIRAGIGCPIMVRGRLWGAMVVLRRDPDPFPPDTEQRVQQFTDLVATAIANAEARSELKRLADQQAALRRVATLVAEAAPPAEVFDAAASESRRLLDAAQVGLVRCDDPASFTVVAFHGHEAERFPAGLRLPTDGDSVTIRVLRTGRSARMDHEHEGSGPVSQLARETGSWSSVGAPITVEGRLWGAITASWVRPVPAPADAEERLVQFAALLATAIANADSRDQLAASRARLLTEADQARRRVVRDLHDGGQQRLVHAIVTLKLAQAAMDTDPQRARSLVDAALRHAEQSNVELRELAHGILPSVLTHGGLRAGIDAVVSRLDLPVRAEVTTQRLAPEIEASAYFIVAEALTNVVKHARATRADVSATVDDGALCLEVRDDGVGGADPHGHGLVGMKDRVAALGGSLRIESPAGSGTRLTVQLPLAS